MLVALWVACFTFATVAGNAAAHGSTCIDVVDERSRASVDAGHQDASAMRGDCLRHFAMLQRATTLGHGSVGHRLATGNQVGGGLLRNTTDTLNVTEDIEPVKIGRTRHTIILPAVVDNGSAPVAANNSPVLQTNTTNRQEFSVDDQSTLPGGIMLPKMDGDSDAMISPIVAENGSAPILARNGSAYLRTNITDQQRASIDDRGDTSTNITYEAKSIENHNESHQPGVRADDNGAEEAEAASARMKRNVMIAGVSVLLPVAFLLVSSGVFGGHETDAVIGAEEDYWGAQYRVGVT